MGTSEEPLRRRFCRGAGCGVVFWICRHCVTGGGAGGSGLMGMASTAGMAVASGGTAAAGKAAAGGVK